MSKPAIDLIGFDRCSGCFACYSSCPQNAVTMQLNEHGFYVPLIDRNLCSECEICASFCPVITHNKDQGGTVFPKAFASWSLDDQTRLQSSSGGIFSELAAYVLNQDGAIFACVWGEGLLPRHSEINDLAGLTSARGSKYVQSHVGRTYVRAVELSKEKEILFVGTPCQAAAMRRFISKDNAHRILIADLVCHGTASIRVFHSYLNFLFAGEKAQQVNFRNKAKGWRNYRFTALSETGRKYSQEHRFDPFFAGYLQNLYLNRICYTCPFCALPKSGDLTLGDYWGVPEELLDEKGVSVVLASTEKGENILNILKHSARIELIPVDFKQTVECNSRMVNGNMEIPLSRELILNDLVQEVGFQTLLKYIHVPSRSRRFAGRIKGMLIKAVKRLLGQSV